MIQDVAGETLNICTCQGDMCNDRTCQVGAIHFSIKSLGFSLLLLNVLHQNILASEVNISLASIVVIELC